MLRTHVTAFDLIKYLKQNIRFFLKCAPIYELPSDIYTMFKCLLSFCKTFFRCYYSILYFILSHDRLLKVKPFLVDITCFICCNWNKTANHLLQNPTRLEPERLSFYRSFFLIWNDLIWVTENAKKYKPQVLHCQFFSKLWSIRVRISNIPLPPNMRVKVTSSRMFEWGGNPFIEMI